MTPESIYTDLKIAFDGLQTEVPRSTIETLCAKASRRLFNKVIDDKIALLNDPSYIDNPDKEIERLQKQKLVIHE